MIQNINNIFAVFMILMCLVLAIFIAFTDLLKENLYGNTRIFFIVLMITYAIFRGYRLYKNIRKQQQEKNN